MTKLTALAAVAAAAVAGLALPFVGWALDVAAEDAVIEAYLDHVGGGDPDDVCVLADPGFPDVAIVGGFAHDRGCMAQAVYVDGDWLAPTVASSAALHAAGWEDAGDEGRAALALAWTRFGAFAWSTPVTAPNEDFAGPQAPAFVPPTSTPDAAAGAVVTLWVQEPGGMLRQADYKLWELSYDREGRMVRIRVLDSFTVRY